MVAFAANSLLCRLALRGGAIDAATFSSVRIVSGAIALWLIVRLTSPGTRKGGSWISALALFAYVAAFSFAYNSLTAGTGALLLFAAVQATMIIWGLHKGEHLHFRQWTGIALASAGLVMLVFPGISTPSVGGSALMVSAGVAWGVYSLRGKGIADPIRATAGNFLRSVPMTALLSLAVLPSARFDRSGITLAIISGAITSGVGYVLWYAALKDLTATGAATVQLSAPVLAAVGGILFLNESLTLRFVISSIAVLGGIALVVTAPRSSIDR
jgi:drug/metabolite transporter (DMT)-like permease